MLLTPDERAVLDMLAEVWNMFAELPEMHTWEKHEFMHAIHHAQLIVMSRPVQRNDFIQRLANNGSQLNAAGAAATEA